MALGFTEKLLHSFRRCGVSGVAELWRQGAKTQAYPDILSFRNAAEGDASAYNMKLFLSEPLIGANHQRFFNK